LLFDDRRLAVVYVLSLKIKQTLKGGTELNILVNLTRLSLSQTHGADEGVIVANDLEKMWKDAAVA
jgi:hypothetical protein